MPKPLFFKHPSEFESWLEKHGLSEPELIVGFYRKSTGKPSLTWPESVDVALCFGWIDGIRKRIDDESYQIRFTPRRRNSIWSARNLERIEVLIAEKKLRPQGLIAYENCDREKAKQYAYEQEHVQLRSEYKRELKNNKAAWNFFQNLAPSYQRPSIWWVESAKQEATQRRRLNKLIELSEQNKVLPQLLRPEIRKKK